MEERQSLQKEMIALADERSKASSRDARRVIDAKLRALAKRGAKLKRLAKMDAARWTPAPFPSTLPPQLVIAWLPLRDVPAALCASSAWRSASEPVLKLVAQRAGLTRPSADISWRHVVLSHTTWAFSEPRRDEYESPGLSGLRTVTNKISGSDMYFVGNGLRVPPNESATFCVTMRKPNIRTVDACGFATLQANGAVSRAYTYNTNGTDYQGIACPFTGMIQRLTRQADWMNPIMSGHTLSVTVCNKPPNLSVKLERVRSDGTRSEIDKRLVFRLTAPSPDEIIVVAPLVRLFTGSSATLGLHKP